MPTIRLWIVVLLLSLQAAALAESAYARYSNDRYGFAIDYPRSFHMGGPPANDDGRRFSAMDSTTLQVYGWNNVDGETLDAAYSAALSKHGRSVRYKARGATWFVVSWLSGGKISYQKTFLGKGSGNAFILTYPVARKNAYTALIERLERSFVPGELSSPH